MVIFALVLFIPLATLRYYLVSSHLLTEERPLQTLATAPFFALLGLFLGWIIWGPIALFALIPGICLFRAAVMLSVAQHWPLRLGIALGSSCAAVTGWAGFILIAPLLGLGITIEDVPPMMFLLCLGIVSAFPAGQLLFPGRGQS
jgi:hypothetical protein